jgi:hypothetical protein
MKVTTKSGFKCDVNERVLDDWRFVKAIAKSTSDDANDKLRGAIDIVSLIMGDNEEAFYKHLSSKDPDGIVSETAVTDDLVSIIDKLKTLKNS